LGLSLGQRPEGGNMIRKFIACLIMTMAIVSVTGFVSTTTATAVSPRVSHWSKGASPNQEHPRAKLRVTLDRRVRAIGFGYPESDTIFFTRRGGVAAGTYVVRALHQPCGSTRTWVGVVRLRNNSLEVGRRFTYTRTCAATAGEKVTYLSGYEPDTNLACPEGSDKMFIVSLEVNKNERIDTFGSFSLKIKGFTDPLVDSGYRFNDQLVEYYFFPTSREAKVLLADLTQSYTFGQYSVGAHDRATVRRACQGQVP